MPSKSSSRVLTDHDEIRRWAEERGAKPSAVRRTHNDENTGIIRLDFPGYSGQDSLEEIDWDEWFEDFDDRNLALIVQDETANGQTSNFNKLVSRDTVEQPSETRSGRGQGSTKTSARGSRNAKSSSSRSSKLSSKSAASKRSSRSDSVGQKRKSTGTKSRSGSRKRAA